MSTKRPLKTNTAYSIHNAPDSLSQIYETFSIAMTVSARIQSTHLHTAQIKNSKNEQKILKNILLTVTFIKECHLKRINLKKSAISLVLII